MILMIWFKNSSSLGKAKFYRPTSPSNLQARCINHSTWLSGTSPLISLKTLYTSAPILQLCEHKIPSLLLLFQCLFSSALLQIEPASCCATGRFVTHERGIFERWSVRDRETWLTIAPSLWNSFRCWLLAKTSLIEARREVLDATEGLHEAIWFAGHSGTAIGDSLIVPGSRAIGCRWPFCYVVGMAMHARDAAGAAKSGDMAGKGSAGWDRWAGKGAGERRRLRRREIRVIWRCLELGD